MPPPSRVRSSALGVAWQAMQPPAKNITLPFSRFGLWAGKLARGNDLRPGDEPECDRADQSQQHDNEQ